jgi:hypothetical protein
MIIKAIMTTGKEKLLAIAFKNRDGKTSYTDWFCDWNTVPNTLRIFHRPNNSIDIKFEDFKSCVKFIFALKYLGQAERVAFVQFFNSLSKPSKEPLEILQNIFGR